MVARHLSYRVFFLTAILIICNASANHVVETNGKEVDRKEIPLTELTVYDVTNVIRSKKFFGETEILPETLFVREINTSAYYYYGANGKARFTNCWGEDWISACSIWHIKGISAMFGDTANKRSLLDITDKFMDSNHEITDTPIAKFLKLNNSFIDSITILLEDGADCEIISKIIEHFTSKLSINQQKNPIRIGVEYNDEFLERCADTWYPLPGSMDHTILRIHVSPLNTMLSFDLFFEMVQSLIIKNRDFIQKLNPSCTLYIRVQSENWNRRFISLAKYERYDALVTKYLRAFSKQVTGNEVYIFRPTLKSVHISGTDQFFWENVTPKYYGVLGEPRFDGSTKKQLACEYHDVAMIMLTNSQTICLYDDRLETLSSLLAACQKSDENTLKHFILPQNSSLSLTVSPLFVKLDEIARRLVEMLENHPTAIQVKTVYIDTKFLNNGRNRNLQNAVSLLQAKNIDVGCYNGDFYNGIKTDNISSFVDKTVKRCGSLLNLSNDIVHDYRLEIKKKKDLLKFLMSFQLAKQHFEKLYPAKTLTLDIDLVVLNSESDYSTFYCDSKVKIKNMYHETLLAFANIHGWSRLGFRAYELNTFYCSVEPDKEISRITTRHSVLFRTNTPRCVDKELPMTYSCIRKTVNAKQSQIGFLETRYLGATFQMNLRENRPLSKAELKTSLLLAMSRFSFIELIAAKGEDLRKAHTVVSDVTQSSRQRSNINEPLVFIEVPLTEATGIGKEMYCVLSNEHIAVHVSNWESSSREQLNLLNDVPQSFNQNFGVTIQNCSHQMNSRLAKLKSLPFMPKLGYVVCNVKPIIPDNLISNSINKYLGTLFYTKSYMESVLSNQNESVNRVEVMFRLNFICSKINKTEQFLRFLNDVTQHSVNYKIRYFVVPAFEPEISSQNCSYSWWRMESYADLTNLTAYVNREDEYTGRPARPHVSDAVKNANTIYLAIIVPIVALFLLAVLGLWLHHQRTKIRVLTEREITSFYNGYEQATPFNTDSDYFDFARMKFPKRCEIRQKDIEIEEIIGSGQYGVVHRGCLSKRTEVAIKIPRLDCGKEQFKSTLAEVKILCHIGEHLNIVSFLGACTKGISNGNLQIVTEYCKNGCLLQFLREGRESDQSVQSITMFQLFGFCHQIAAGMEYVAEKRVVHGDLAARNVLLTEELTCKIADFGLSRRLYEMSEYVKSSQEPLPWRWMAPESLRDMEFTVKSDVWSYGITLWEIFSLGMVPYPGINWTVNYVTELENGMRMDKALHATDDIHAKTLECWNKNSDLRPTFTNLKQCFIGLRNEQYIKLDQL